MLVEYGIGAGSAGGQGGGLSGLPVVGGMDPTLLVLCAGALLVLLLWMIRS